MALLLWANLTGIALFLGIAFAAQLEDRRITGPAALGTAPPDCAGKSSSSLSDEPRMARTPRGGHRTRGVLVVRPAQVTDGAKEREPSASVTFYDGDRCRLAALLWIKLPGESDGICGGETAYLFSRPRHDLTVNSPFVPEEGRRLAARYVLPAGSALVF